MKKGITLLIVLLAISGGGYYYFAGKAAEDTEGSPGYEFSKVERATVLNMVSSTGELAARDIVEVGTQVSGTLSEVLVDFNDMVEQDQLIAVIDPSVLDAQVKSARADLIRTQAQLQQAQNNLNRFQPVHEEGFLSDNDFEPYKISVMTAEANVMSSEAGLDRALRNRGYAEVRAPISGIVIDRTVEPGQTVAASLNTPRLFTIANDLSKMEILAKVDESDIGQIKVGQEARFTVAAYLDDAFVGQVEEIRLLPDVVQNVVTYTVVVTAENPDGKLLPGMTATIDFVIEEVEDALSVPSSALNLRPNGEMMALIQEQRAARMAAAGGDGAGSRRQGVPGESGRAGPGAFAGRSSDRALLWYLEDGSLKFMPVRKGVSDGARTEVIPVRDRVIEENMEIITKVVSPSGGPGSRTGGRPTGLRRLGF